MTRQSQGSGVEQNTAAESRDQRLQRETALNRQTNSLPVALESDSIAPKSETGMVEAIKLGSEGHDNDESQDAPLAVGETQPTHVSPRKPVILLVEDTTELAEVIQAALHRIDFDTIHESHGGRALNRYGDLNPDLILLDIGLPDITGWQFLEGIKTRHKHAGSSVPPVIVITAFGDPANRLVGKFQGVQDYLIKPFTAAEVERVVTKALSVQD